VAENAVLHFEQGRITEVAHCPASCRFACANPTLHSRASSESGQAQGRDDDSPRVATVSTSTYFVHIFRFDKATGDADLTSLLLGKHDGGHRAIRFGDDPDASAVPQFVGRERARAVAHGP
jgi:hypothetical protein